MNGFVTKDPSDGRLLVWDGDLFSAKFVDGIWSKGTFSAYDLKDNFERVRDETEAIKALNSA
jgi:hypothetical protein